MTELIEVGQSELADFRQCPLKHRFRWRDGWYLPSAPGRQNDPKAASELGTQYHSILAAHYTAIQSGIRDVDRLAAVGGAQIAALADILDLDEDRVALLTWMHAGYLERWGADLDWEVVAIEQTVRSPLWDPRIGEPTRFVLRWTADLVVRVISLGGRIAIVDNKTTAAQGVWSKEDVDLHDQLGLYHRGWSRDHPDDPAIYGMLNQVRRDRLKTRELGLGERFRRLRSTRTRKELDEIELDAIDDLERMHSARNLERPTSHPNPKECGWKCDFKEAHIALRRSGGDWSHALGIIQARGMSNDPANDPALARHV